MYKKILVAYDGSKLSENALDNSIEIAKAFGSEIIILHVIQEIPTPPFTSGIKFKSKTGELVGIKEYLNDLYKEAKAKMIEKIEQKKEQSNYSNIKVLILVGDPSKVIIKTAKNEKVDLIVIGATALPGLSRIKALGSVSRNIIEHTNISILLVR